MKKYLLIITLAISSLTIAQQRGRLKDASPEERAEMQTKRMTKDLALNKDQEQKVNTVLKEHHAKLEVKRQEIKKDSLEAKTEKRKKAMEGLKASQDDLKSKMKGILTDEQYKKWETLQNERIDKVKNHKRKGKE